MKLLLRRDQRTAGLLGNRTMFVLEVRADLTDAERAAIKRCDLGDLVIFQRNPKRFVEVDGEDKFDNWMLDVMDVEILAKELVDGRRFECRNIQEMMRAERAIRKAAEHFAMVLWRAQNFAGEEVMAFEANETKWASWMTS